MTSLSARISSAANSRNRLSIARLHIQARRSNTKTMKRGSQQNLTGSTVLASDSLSWLTDDTVFEDTSPAPDGRRIVGKADVVAFWRAWFAQNADAHFDAEDLIVSGDRAVVPWVYRKQRNGQPWRLRGVDFFRVRDGKVGEKSACVKG